MHPPARRASAPIDIVHPRLSAREADTISQGEWFATLDVDVRGALVRNSRVVRVDAKTSSHVLCMAVGGSLYCVVKGAAKLSKTMASGRKLAIDLIEPGAWFGVSFCRDDKLDRYAIESRGDLVLLVVDQRELQLLRIMYPPLVSALFTLHERLVHRLGAMLEELQDMTLATRLVRRLVAIAKHFGVPEAGGLRLAVPLSQQDLADLTGASRQRVNLEIKALERRGLLRTIRGQIELQHPLLPAAQCHDPSEKQRKPSATISIAA